MSRRNKGDFYNLLFNVDKIFVRPCYIDAYIKFSHELNEYLFCKYPEFYAGLQLYQSKEEESRFTVITAYYDVRNIYREIEKICKDIDEIYKDVWRDNIRRECIFTFCNNIRII
ncbi:MAG TPA: hypothetical protein DHW61_06490 [Lachnoclostridium phytofermentans]|uniref:ABM domain-containing protein n=1 Tax=Lachnoclostridium phytofermentans TaxID=66219 RepID=A0A3D2X672_9FIRM|nr:hypothetical protein [Lachnoclostridium sp.]HCL02055.1 hypothetical protein [Lachnoclostridium phytofermentans]